MQMQVPKGRAKLRTQQPAPGGRAGRSARGSERVQELPGRGRWPEAAHRAESFADHYSQARLFCARWITGGAGAYRLRLRVRSEQGVDHRTSAPRSSPICATSTRNWRSASPMAWRSTCPTRRRPVRRCATCPPPPALRIVRGRWRSIRWRGAPWASCSPTHRSRGIRIGRSRR